MSPDTLSRQAIRIAQRQSRKAGRALKRDELLQIRVQTVELWKRVVVIVLGLSGGVLAFVCYCAEAPMWVWAAFGAGSLAAVLCGVLGKKAYLNRELKKLSKDGPTRILDAIMNAL